MNSITLQNNKLIINFKFDPFIVSKIRTIDGRFWNSNLKRWEAPLENVEEVLNVLIPLNFSVSDEVSRYRRVEKEKMDGILAIKNNDSAVYEGNLPLHDFQKKGAMFLKQMPNALLGDVPGLGKTIQVLAATEQDSHILIFTMNTLKYNMSGEIEKWFPGAKVLVINGNKQQRTEQWTLYAKKNKYVVANYELLVHDFDIISKFKWATIVCDEATRISNPEAISSKNLKKLESIKRIALSGTPVSNSPIDIFGIFDFLVPKYLGTFYQFKDKYCVTDPRFNNVVGYKNMSELSEKVNRFMLRRKKEEVFKDLPSKIVENVIFQLSDTEKKLYKSVKERIVAEIQELSDMDTKNLNVVPVKMLRLKQCTNHTRLIGDLACDGKGESSKLEALKSILEPIIASGGKAIVFTQFAECLHILAEELEAYRPICVYGAVDSADRMKLVKEFNDDPEPRIAIFTEAGAYGLNMKSASYVIHYDSPWSIAKLEQREGRADRSADKRIGGELPVTVYNLIAKDTIDEYILKVLARKNKVSVDILQDSIRLEEQGMSQEDIDEILRL